MDAGDLIRIVSGEDSLPKGIGDGPYRKCGILFSRAKSGEDSLPKGIGDAFLAFHARIWRGVSGEDSLPKGIGDIQLRRLPD